MPVIPRSARVRSSPSSVTPLLFLSCQTLRFAKISSLASMTPSPFLSYCASASNPFWAIVPSGRRVEVPNNSEPSLMIPSPFKSMASRPSFGPAHSVFSASPLLSSSKCTPSSTLSILKPSPSRSITSGSAMYRHMARASSYSS